MDRLLRTLGRMLGSRVVNTKVTSYGAIEIDVFAASKADFELFVAASEPLGRIEFRRDLQEPAQFLAPPEALDEARRLFNQERYWEAHEVLEAVWRTATGDEKSLLQGLILVCASLVHKQKGNDRVAMSVAERALPKLHWSEPVYHGVDVQSVRETVSRMVSSGTISTFRL